MRLYDGSGNAASDHGFGAPHSHNWKGKIRDLGNLSLQNIVYSIEILEPCTQRHERAERILANAESWNDSKADKVAQLFSTCGLELVIEFDALEIREDASTKDHGI